MAIIYARQSLDRNGEGAAVERQIADCRALAERRGWDVTEVLTDNDISASTGAKRPGYTKLLDLMAAGTVDVVIVWHVDRLTRRLVDLEHIIALCEQTGVRLATVTGDLDLATDTGRMLARILASVARGEVERKGARQRRANRQRAEKGHVGWTRRPFGYDREGDRIHVVDDEADLIRKAARDVLAGRPLGTIVKDWNAAGVTTTPGGRWGTTQLRRLLMNPRHIGRAVYRGEDMGAGTWEPILDDDTFTRLEEILNDPGRRTSNTTERKYLLSGLMLCGVCGKPCYASPYGPKGRRYLVYRCHAYHLTRRLDRVDQVVEDTVKVTLTHPGIIARLTPNVDVEALRAEVVELRERRDALAGLLAEGLMSGQAVREQAGKITTRIRAVEDAITTAVGDNPAARLAAAPDVAAAWDALDLATKRAVVETLMTVTLLPAGKGVRFNDEHVQMEPRV